MKKVVSLPLFFCTLQDLYYVPSYFFLDKQSRKSSPLHISEEDEANKNKTLESSSDDNGGFVTPPGIPRSSRVKRATVVGNPMFSNTPDSEIGPGESLGLDDLDMDYEQIMHYFDNLKVGI